MCACVHLPVDKDLTLQKHLFVILYLLLNSSPKRICMRVASLQAEHARTFDVVNTLNTLVAISAYPTCTCKHHCGPLQCISNKISIDKLVSRSLPLVAVLYNPDIPTFDCDRLLSLLNILSDSSDQLGFLLRRYHNPHWSLLFIQYDLTQPTTNPYSLLPCLLQVLKDSSDFSSPAFDTPTMAR